jgi:hypothetical protein
MAVSKDGNINNLKRHLWRNHASALTPEQLNTNLVKSIGKVNPVNIQTSKQLEIIRKLIELFSFIYRK